jgi:hypothetical protein
MMSIPTSLLATASLLVLVASSHSPVAVVEDVTGSPAGIRFMDYVEAGRVIRLGPEDSIVLGYLTSCWRETITGGTVTVGSERSDVEGGMVERSTVACEGSKMQLTAELANTSGAMVFRDLSQSGRQAAPLRPQFTLYGRSPVIEVKPEGTLVIERVDKPGERHEVVLGGERMVRGAFLDLAKVGVELAAGGIYRAKAGREEIVFQIDRDAQPGETPIVGRLLRLQPAS